MVAYLRSLWRCAHARGFRRDRRGEYVEPISTNFRGHDIYECPPNGQGIIALMILNILSRFLAGDDPLSPDRLHVEIEATRLAYAARNRCIADPTQADVPVSLSLI